MKFDILVNEILRKDVKVGDDIENINPDCEHYKTKGKVKKVVSRPEKPDIADIIISILL